MLVSFQGGLTRSGDTIYTLAEMYGRHKEKAYVDVVESFETALSKKFYRIL